ncbi:MAG TPA: Holliday junction branch migration protein RuvA, partial [Gemmatimonadales bacterium]|nr:Holliday junction branch migration protein RuvA [Gemmatimonadales bacterium]
MIAGLSGTLAALDGEEALVQTDGGVAYAVHLPLGVAARLPAPGGRVALHTELVVREDGWTLFGFDRVEERTVFRRLLEAAGFGPRLALAMLSTLGPERTVRSIREKDLAALSTVSGVGRKKAERLVLELRDRFDDLPAAPATAPAGSAAVGAAGA